MTSRYVDSSHDPLKPLPSLRLRIPKRPISVDSVIRWVKVPSVIVHLSRLPWTRLKWTTSSRLSSHPGHQVSHITHNENVYLYIILNYTKYEHQGVGHSRYPLRGLTLFDVHLFTITDSVVSGLLGRFNVQIHWLLKRLTSETVSPRRR